MRIAHIPSNGLGDGLIQTIIAQNLIRLGHKVDYFHNMVSGLNAIFRSFNVEPAHSLGGQRLEAYDWLLIDKGFHGLHAILADPILTSRAVVYSMSKTLPNPGLFNIQVAEVDNPDDRCLLMSFNAKCVRRNKSVGTIADQLVHVFGHEFGLSAASKSIDLDFPQSWQKAKYSSRVILHPTSSREAKNWTKSGYLALADRLKSSGMEPTFSLAPSELAEWQFLIGNKHKCLSYPELMDLAKDYFESGVFVGNDSGNGHLASLLGMPSVSIFSTRKKTYAWRPSWGENTVVRPYLSRRLLGKKMWKKTVTTQRIYQIVRHQLESN